MAVNASRELGGDTAFALEESFFYIVWDLNLLRYALNLSFIPLKYGVGRKLAF